MDRGRTRCVSDGVGFEGARGTGRGERGTRGEGSDVRSDRWGRIEWMGWRTLRALVLPMVCEGLNAVALGGLVFR